MKILFDHSFPFFAAHGGLQIQIEQTKHALEQLGIEVEFLRWWDEKQSGDIVHYFGRPSFEYVFHIQKKGLKVVMNELLTQAGSRSAAQLRLQKGMIRAAQRLVPGALMERMAWRSYRQVDAVVALTELEAHLMQELFQAPPKRVHVVPNGVELAFLNSRPRDRGVWLVCTAIIVKRKQVLELAQAARVAQTPIWCIGKPFSENDPYAKEFLALAHKHPEIIRYEGPINDREKLAQIYREARGFVLLSLQESLSLSALEAAACECPLLLSDLPWARTTFHDHAMYCPSRKSIHTTAQVLKAFYTAAPNMKPPPRPAGWLDVAKQLRSIYQDLLDKTSR
jgi:glycosyltransferase involved in cell wall biosynthesis